MNRVIWVLMGILFACGYTHAWGNTPENPCESAASSPSLGFLTREEWLRASQFHPGEPKDTLDQMIQRAVSLSSLRPNAAVFDLDGTLENARARTQAALQNWAAQPEAHAHPLIRDAMLGARPEHFGNFVYDTFEALGLDYRLHKDAVEDLSRFARQQYNEPENILVDVETPGAVNFVQRILSATEGKPFPTQIIYLSARHVIQLDVSKTRMAAQGFPTEERARFIFKPRAGDHSGIFKRDNLVRIEQGGVEIVFFAENEPDCIHHVAQVLRPDAMLVFLDTVSYTHLDPVTTPAKNVFRVPHFLFQ